MAGQSGRISPGVTDISDTDQLLSYATAGQLAQVQMHSPYVSQGKIAHAAGLGSTSRIAAPALSLALRRGPSPAQLERLDEVIGPLASDVGSTGGLSSLALRLSGWRFEGTNLIARIPPGWISKIIRSPPSGDVGVLVQASALLSAFRAADKMDTAGRSVSNIRDRYSEELELLVPRLILISVAPPTSSSYDAQMILGSLASYTFETMRDRLEYELRYSPLGFRVWRAIAQLVALSSQGKHTDALKSWVRQLMRDAEELRKGSLYAGSSLDLELANIIPIAWSPPHDDWISEALLKRAWNREATIRERGAAAMGLWQRELTVRSPNLVSIEKELRGLITEFRDPGARPDAPAGLRWVAATLEYVIEHRVAVCNEWPDVDEPWLRHVQAAAGELDKSGIPPHLHLGTKNLFLHMILQNAGMYRRRAIETVVTSGWNEPVARVLGFLLQNERDETWLRIRAEFALGYLQRLDRSTVTDLTRACVTAYENLKPDELADGIPPPRARVTEMHAALFAVGDCLGVEGAEEPAKMAREALRGILSELASLEGERALRLRRATRAAAYMLTFTAQPRVGEEKDLSQELLEKFSRHPDQVTAELSQWALGFRFAPDGRIRSLLATADFRV